MKGKFYAVGVGPGDPALITFKAAETIRKADVIFATKSGAKVNVALKIADAHLSGKYVEQVDMPMIRDEDVLKTAHELASDKVALHLEDGRSVAFLTLGDPSIYSSAMYVHKILTERGYSTQLVPGIPSFCAAAASLNTSLCEGEQPLHIIPSCYGGALDYDGNVVMMKGGNQLKEIPGYDQFMVVENASMENERVLCKLGENDDLGYFSIAIVKGGGK